MDICTIDFLDEMVDAGVRVLKLEGRARGPEYVGVVTRAYRKAVEALASGSYDDRLKAGLFEDLRGVYNRGLSSGYYLGRDQSWSGARGSKATQQKVYVGEVTHYFGRLGVAEIMACAGTIGKGKDYVIIGRTTGALEGTIDEMHDDDGVIETAEQNVLFSIKVDRKVRLKDKLYRMEPVPA